MIGLAVLAAGLGCCTLAQAGGPDPLSFNQLTRRAGFICAGRVVRVERPAFLPGRLPLVQVGFRVERALRGTRAGATLTFLQWAGAWENGPQVRPGQRLLLFLYPLSPAGLTSVVGGGLGQFDLDKTGNIVLRTDQQRLLAPDGPPGVQTGGGPTARLPYGVFAGRVRQAAQP